MEYNVISFGAGTQSTALVLLALENKIKCDLIVFADTGAEPKYVIEHMELIKQMCEDKIPFIVAKPKKPLEQAVNDFADEKEKCGAKIPFFTSNGCMMRQCTADFKIQPIKREVRSFFKLKKGDMVNMSLGITTDEILRAKPSRVNWQKNIFPLLEMEMSRTDAIKFCNVRGVFPPKSACWLCPYRSVENWLDLRKRDKESYKKACDLDKKVRNNKRMKEQLFLYNKKRDLETAIENHAFVDENQISIFDIENMECDGGCFL